MGVIELDERLRSLRAHARTWGAELRAVAEQVATDPDAVTRLTDMPVYRYLATGPSTDDDPPLTTADGVFRMDTVLEQVVFFEELAYGDVGALMAAPGAPLAGPLVQGLGDAAQREWFFGRLRAAPTFTFFALTEPDRGSDAGALSTALSEDGAGFRLTGTKKYIGNASRAQLGVVFARAHPGPLGVRAVMVDSSDPGFSAAALPTVGLTGALLGEINFDDVPIPADRLLGSHLPATRRGAWAWTRMFNRLRPRVATMAIGLARAAHDYVVAQRRAPRTSEGERMADLALRIGGAKQLVRRAAVAVDRNPNDGHLASAAKVAAARVAEEATLLGAELLGPGARFEHPVFDRLVRDVRGFEFMEGAGNVQKLSVAQQLTRGRIHNG